MINLTLADLKHPIPTHWQPLVLAIANGAELLSILQGSGRFDMPTGWPTIVLVGDDLHDAQGPDAFHAESLRRAIKASHRGVIVSSGPEKAAYAAAGMTALLLRKNTILIETRPEQEISWIQFVQAANPNIPLFVSTVKGGTA
jgi:hypothetical protein